MVTDSARNTCVNRVQLQLHFSIFHSMTPMGNVETSLKSTSYANATMQLTKTTAHRALPI